MAQKTQNDINALAGVTGQQGMQIRGSQSLAGVDFSTPESYINWLSQNDPYAGQSKMSTSILPAKRRIENANSMLDYQEKSADYQNSLAQTLFELQYNSEGAKAQRMRNAGMNPDLLGIGDASEANGRDIYEATPTEGPQSDPSQELQTAFTVATGIFSFATGLVESLQNINAKRLTENATIEEIARKAVSESDYDLMGDTENITNLEEIAKNILGDTEHMVSSRSQRRRLKASIERNIHSLRTLAERYAYKDEHRKRQLDFIGNSAKIESLGYSEQQQISTLRIISEYIRETEDIERESARAQAKQEKAYNETFDGKLSAEASNSTNREVMAQNQYNADKRKPARKLIRALAKQCDDEPGLWSYAALIGGSAVLSAIDNFSVSRSFGFDSKGKKASTTFGF